MSSGERLYALLLKAYPAEHRAEFGPEMCQAFRALGRDFRGRGPFRYARFLLSEAIWILYHGVRERAQRAFGPGRGRGSLEPAGKQVGFAGRRLQDLRHAARSLRRSPGFALTAVLTTALGIGASVSVYSVVRAVLIEPLPYRNADRIVHVWNRTNWGYPIIGAHRDMADYRKWTMLFEGFASKAIIPSSTTLTRGDGAEALQLEAVSPNFFSLLGVDPVLGRTFLPEDVTPPPPPLPGETMPVRLTPVVISYGLWQRALGGDPAVVGGPITLNGWPVRVVGVLPRGFTILTPGERARDGGADLWMPQTVDPANRPYGLRNQMIIGRMKPGVSLEQAQAEMDAVAHRLREAFAEYEHEELEIVLRPALKDVVNSVDEPLLVLAGAVAFLLLLSCANVANLFLVRGRVRTLDTAVRSALGCGRRRLVSEMMTESGLIAVLGGLAGVGLTMAAIRTLMALRPASLPRFDSVELNGPVLLFALVVSLLSALLSGLLPAIRGSRLDLVAAMKGQGGGGGGRARDAVLNGSVVAGVALSMVLLIGAGLMVRTFAEMQRIDTGFDAEGVLTFGIQLYGQAYRGETAHRESIRDLERRIAALPGVQAVGSDQVMPIVGGGLWNGNWAWDEAREASYDAAARFRSPTKDYFEAMGMRLLAGRPFTEAEMLEPSSVAIVNEALVDRAWPGQNPIGRTVIATDAHLRLEVVGVVESAPFRTLTREFIPAVYFPFGSRPNVRRQFAVRTSGDPGDLVGPIRSVIRDFDPNLAMSNVAPLEDAVSGSLAPTRFLLVLMEIFGVVSGTLAVVGLYGVISFAVRSRTSEIGIRLALGAHRVRILGSVFGQAFSLIALGIVIGVAGSMALSRFAESVLYGVAPDDPMAILGAAALLGSASVLACCLPAWKGANADPMATLRSV